jgi:ParB-like chromosome segregation protein Spo0J
MTNVETQSIANEQDRNLAGAAAPVYQQIRIADLILSDGPPPTAALINNIRQYGIFEDVIVRPFRSRFKVIAGRRRVAALKRIANEEGYDNWGEQLVPCKIITDADLALAALVATNNLGKANPLADLDAIHQLTKKLLKTGSNQREIEKHIFKTLGLTAATQRKRLKLASLKSEFRFALGEGCLSVANAEKITALPEELQAKLLVLLDEKGSLTTKDVQEVKTVRATSLLISLFDRIAGSEMPSQAAAATGD